MTASFTNNKNPEIPDPQANQISLRVLDIVEGTSVDGPGLRTSIYFAGCDHRCPGCHNPQSWDFNGGRIMSLSEIMDVVIENDFNVTFSGGDPLYQLAGITELAKRIKAIGKTIWCYTGVFYEDIISKTEYAELLAAIDVLGDGPFIEDLRDISLLFRGSSNQRIIELKKS